MMSNIVYDFSDIEQRKEIAKKNWEEHINAVFSDFATDEELDEILDCFLELAKIFAKFADAKLLKYETLLTGYNLNLSFKNDAPKEMVVRLFGRTCFTWNSELGYSWVFNRKDRKMEFKKCIIESIRDTGKPVDSFIKKAEDFKIRVLTYLEEINSSVEKKWSERFEPLSIKR